MPLNSLKLSIDPSDALRGVCKVCKPLARASVSSLAEQQEKSRRQLGTAASPSAGWRFAAMKAPIGKAPLDRSDGLLYRKVSRDLKPGENGTPCQARPIAERFAGDAATARLAKRPSRGTSSLLCAQPLARVFQLQIRGKASILPCRIFRRAYLLPSSDALLPSEASWRPAPSRRDPWPWPRSP